MKNLKIAQARVCLRDVADYSQSALPKINAIAALALAAMESTHSVANTMAIGLALETIADLASFANDCIVTEIEKCIDLEVDDARSRRFASICAFRRTMENGTDTGGGV